METSNRYVYQETKHRSRPFINDSNAYDIDPATNASNEEHHPIGTDN